MRKRHCVLSESGTSHAYCKPVAIAVMRFHVAPLLALYSSTTFFAESTPAHRIVSIVPGTRCSPPFGETMRNCAPAAQAVSNNNASKTGRFMDVNIIEQLTYGCANIRTEIDIRKRWMREGL